MTATTEHCPPATAALKSGWINTYYRYYKGKKLGPYYVRRWKENGRVCKEYIKPKDVERVRAECERYREIANVWEEFIRSNNRYIDNFGFYLRMVVLFRKGKRICRPYVEFYSRLWREGFRIYGRPSLRRKITRQLQIVDGQQVIVRTIHEIDGTKTVSIVPANRRQTADDRRPTNFMVPPSDKNENRFKEVYKTTFEQQFADLYKSIFGHQSKLIINH